MPYDKDSPMGDAIAPAEDEVMETMVELAQRWIYVADPKFYAPLHMDHKGELRLLPPFWGGVAIVLDTTAGLKIGPFCYIDDFAVVMTHEHPMDPLAVRFWESIPKPKEIGAWVYIGVRATIMPSCAIIGEGAYIEAGSVVFDDVGPYEYWHGNPAEFDSNRKVRVEDQASVLDLFGIDDMASYQAEGGMKE